MFVTPRLYYFILVITLLLVLLSSSSDALDDHDVNNTSKAQTTTTTTTTTATTTTVLNVLDFGAIGNGLVEDTQAIQNAIDHATNISATTSTIPTSTISNNEEDQQAVVVVLFPTAHNFLSGPLNITGGNHMVLQIDGNVTAISNDTTTLGVAWDPQRTWPQIGPLPSYGNSRDMGLYWQYQPFVNIRHSSHLQIHGQGVIDGRGHWWWDATGKHSDRSSILTAGRPNLMRLVNCTHVEISEVTLYNSPFWCLHPVQCSYVHVHHVTIRSPLHAWNSDGIDPDSSQHVLIEYNDIGVGDDHIAIKAGVCGYGSPNDCREEAWSTSDSGVYTTKNVTVRYNTFRNGMGVALGSELSGGIQDILVHDNVIGLCAHGLDPPPDDVCGWGHAMHLKTTVTRGGFLRNIQFVNNTIYNNTGFLLLEATYNTNTNPPVPLPNYPTTTIQNITIQGNMGLGMASHATFHCSDMIVCEDIIVKDNVIGGGAAPNHSSSTDDDWSCEYIDRYDVSDNVPSGLEDCMYHSMDRQTTNTNTNTNTTTRSRMAGMMSTRIMAIIVGALLVGVGSISVGAIFQGCRHRYIEIEISHHTTTVDVGASLEMHQGKPSTVLRHRNISPTTRTEKSSVVSTTVHEDDDDDDNGLL